MPQPAESFEAVYRANVGTVLGFLTSRVGRHTAEDLTAETFARAYAAFDRYEDRGLPHRAWLLRIAHNLVIQRARRRDSSDIPLSSSRDPGLDLSHEFDVPIEVAELRRAIDNLSEAHRTVIDLRYLRELSVPETAAVLDLSDEAVRALTYRALERLRATLPRDAD